MTRDGVFEEPLFSLYVARHFLDADQGLGSSGGSLDMGYAVLRFVTLCK